MADLDIAYAIKNKKRKPAFDDYSNYFFLIFPFALIVIDCIIAYLSAKSAVNGPSPKIGMLAICFAILLVCIAFAYWILIRLRQNISFKSTLTPLLKADNYQLVADVIKQNHFTSTQLPAYIKCATRISLFSWGEEIIFIPLDNEILINSHPLYQPITFIKDVKNIWRIERQINDAIAGQTQTS